MIQTKSYGTVKLLAFTTDFRTTRRRKTKPAYSMLTGFIVERNGIPFLITKEEGEINNYDELPNKI